MSEFVTVKSIIQDLEAIKADLSADKGNFKELSDRLKILADRCLVFEFLKTLPKSKICGTK